MVKKIRCTKFRRCSQIVIYLQFFIISILILSLILYSSIFVKGSDVEQDEPPRLDGTTVTPRNGFVNDDYVFLTNYYDPNNQPPSYIKLVVDDTSYDLQPINPQDLNYSDGKSYFIRLELSKGIHIFHFEASNGELTTYSKPSTLTVNEEASEYTHLDIAYSIVFATIIILIVVLLGVYQLKKMTRTLTGIQQTKEKAKDSDPNQDRKKSKN